MVTGSSADADGADDLAVALERDATGEDHHPTVVGGVDAVELLTGLGEVAEVCGGCVERAGREGFVDRDVNMVLTGSLLRVMPHTVRNPPKTLLLWSVRW